MCNSITRSWGVMRYCLLISPQSRFPNDRNRCFSLESRSLLLWCHLCMERRWYSLQFGNSVDHDQHKVSKLIEIPEIIDFFSEPWDLRTTFWLQFAQWAISLIKCVRFSAVLCKYRNSRLEPSFNFVFCSKFSMKLTVISALCSWYSFF